MGEIRVKIKLTNASDMAQARRGKLPQDQVRSVELDGIVDTGAVATVIPVNVQQLLGLEIEYNRVAGLADGRMESVGMTEPMLMECMDRKTFEEAMVLGTEVLIGQTVLEKLDLLADCRDRKLIPHPGRPNQPVSMVR
jgi:predicted aspartyl protease